LTSLPPIDWAKPEPEVVEPLVKAVDGMSDGEKRGVIPQVPNPDGAFLDMVAGNAKVATTDFLVASQIGAEDLLHEVFKRPDKSVVFRA
jgi:hypothetical protein